MHGTAEAHEHREHSEDHSHVHTHHTTTPARPDADKHHAKEARAKDGAAPRHRAEAVANGAMAAAVAMAAAEQRHASGAQPSVSQGQPHVSSARPWEQMKGEGASPEVRGCACVVHITKRTRGRGAAAQPTADSRGESVCCDCRRRRRRWGMARVARRGRWVAPGHMGARHMRITR
jgi:hypothetical protein